MMHPGTLAKLYTADGKYVATVESLVPPFQLGEVVVWGSRVFVWIDREPGVETKYKEVMPVVVTEVK